MALFAERNQKIGSENAFKVGPHIVHVDKSRGPVVKLNLGEPDYDLPKAVNAEIKRQLDLGNTHYCDPQGTPNLRSAISEYVNRTRGLKTTPGHVVVFPGGKPSIGLTQQIYCNPGDEVIYPSPGFPIYESFIRYVQAVPVPLHLDESAGFTFTSQQLAELITPRTKVIYLNFPSNPTGGVASQAQIEEIADVILRKAHADVRVYSDEIYERIVLIASSTIPFFKCRNGRTHDPSQWFLQNICLDWRKDRLRCFTDCRRSRDVQNFKYQLLLMCCSLQSGSSSSRAY